MMLPVLLRLLGVCAPCVQAAAVSTATPAPDAWDSIGMAPSRSFARIPVRRAEEHDRAIYERDQRVARHREQIATYERNLLDERKISDHLDLLDSAVKLEQGYLIKRASAADGGSAPLTDFYAEGTDIGYSGNVSVGTPGQTFSLVPDTGSADLWVPGNQATDPGHNLFNPSSSSSYQSSSTTFSISYGLGQAAGQVGRDTVQFAGFSVSNKTFGVATKLDSQFQQQDNDGIMGMANSIIANMSAYTYFEDLVSLKLINNPYFSVFLSRGRQYTSAEQAYVAGSSICMGCMAQPVNAQTSGSMFYVPVTTFAFWEVQVAGISLNSQAIGSTSHLAIVDTGTTALYLPITVASAMMATVKGQVQKDGSYLVPVSAVSDSTQFTFNFAGGNININILDLIAGYADSTRRYFLMNVYAADTQDTNGKNIAILGDVFIKNALTVFSYSNNGAPAVGLQQLNANAAGDTTSVAVVTQTAGQPAATTGTLRQTRTSAAFTFITGNAASSRSAGDKVELKGVFGLGGALVGVIVGALTVF